MSRKKKRPARARAEPQAKQARAVAWLTTQEAYDMLCSTGYTSLAKCPEIIAGVDRIASLVASMTIHLMRNSDHGDVRVQNGLSRLVDIRPNKLMTRYQLIAWTVRTLYLEGNGNAFWWPRTERGYIAELIPIPPTAAYALPDSDGWGYSVQINGTRYEPDELVHFTLNPSPDRPWNGEGYRVPLKAVADNLKQIAVTEKGYLSEKWKPSLIVKVDGLTEGFASQAGRKKLLEEYVASSEAGAPWVIPAEQFDVQSVKPLTLGDLAIADVATMDKRTVAAILGIPPFVLGVGDFNRDAWNNFISTRLMPLATSMQQRMTMALLYSPDLYFRFNARSLYAYDIKELASVADAQFVRGIMTGNEVRDWLNLTPLEGLDELVILENYIPRGMIGDQNKLQGGGENE